MSGTKKLGFGFMRLPQTNPDDPKSIDMEQLCRMVDAFLERGFTYFDTPEFDQRLLWWRRRESNPRPKTNPYSFLRV